ncbi:ribonuclease R [Anaerotignum faecicola]|nr:ribonuclease R [Anaerotignum faecicola]
MDETLRQERKGKILDFIKSEGYIPLKRGEMCVVLDVPGNERHIFDDIADELIHEGKIIETRKGKLMLPKELNLAAGTFTGNARGFGFVTPDEGEGDIFIPAEYTMGAMHKDRVLVRITGDASNGRRAEGQITKILEKGTDRIVGTFELLKGFGFVVCDDKKLPQDIFISKENTKGAVTGHKVVVKITKRPEGSRSPEGVITEILGHIDDPGVDILSVIRQFDLPEDFSEEAYRQTEKIPIDITQAEIDGREDLRDIVTVTIDGDDSKDFDDAVSIDILENGNFLLGVHIADVSHYVTEGSPLDREALERGTSYYLVDRVIPMIPHKLSNGICSLNPDEDRLTLSCIMEIDRNGTVVDHKIVKSVIHSHARLTYTNVNKIIEFNDSELCERYKELVPMLNDMNKLRMILARKRQRRGSVNFDFPEAKIELDRDGHVLDIRPYERNSATNLIEEFMLAANETVAEDYYWRQTPFVFRNHESPDDEKVESMKKMLRTFGYRIKGQNDLHPKDIQGIIDSVAGKDEEHIVSRIILRSLKQARYQDENFGHFGLAAKYYCHFTSPIRRYPDLQIHRIIKDSIEGRLDEKRLRHYGNILSDVAKQCSARERLADDAERETDKLKMVEYMCGHIGEVFDGIISGVTGWGIYVELGNTVEGMVSLASLEDDFYLYDENTMQVQGQKHGRVYHIGQKVRVEVLKADKEQRTIDFGFYEE